MPSYEWHRCRMCRLYYSGEIAHQIVNLIAGASKKVRVKTRVQVIMQHNQLRSFAAPLLPPYTVRSNAQNVTVSESVSVPRSSCNLCYYQWRNEAVQYYSHAESCQVVREHARHDFVPV